MGTKIDEMKKKNSLINWTPLSPKEIYERHLAMYDWSNKAEKLYLELETEFAKGQIKELLVKLLRKTSAVEALKVMLQISEELNLPSLLEFCNQEKFSGLLGVNQVVNMTLSGLYFHSGILKNRSIFGGIVLDYDRRAKLGLMLEEHDTIQLAIDEESNYGKMQIRRQIESLMTCSMTGMYPVSTMLGSGIYLKAALSLISNPIELGLIWTKIDCKNRADVYSIARDKQDGGFFQYLCIVLFSLKF